MFSKAVLENLHPSCFILTDEHEQLTAENTDDSNHDGDKMGAPLREQDRFLPIANVAKIMKKAIPDTGKVNNKVRISFYASCSYIVEPIFTYQVLDCKRC